MITVIYGPKGCGKTRNTSNIGKFFNAHVLDEGMLGGPRTPLQLLTVAKECLPNCVILTNRERTEFSCFDGIVIRSFDDVMSDMRIESFNRTYEGNALKRGQYDK